MISAPGVLVARHGPGRHARQADRGVQRPVGPDRDVWPSCLFADVGLECDHGTAEHETAISVIGDSVEVVSEGHWEQVDAG